MSSESYISSMGGTSDGAGEISPAQHQFSEAKGGGFFFFSVDRRYMVNTRTNPDPGPNLNPSLNPSLNPNPTPTPTPTPTPNLTRYMVKTMDAVEHRTLLQMLPGLCAHLQASSDERGAPRSLLTRISGVYSIRMYAGPCADPVPNPVLNPVLPCVGPPSLARLTSHSLSCFARSPHAHAQHAHAHVTCTRTCACTCDMHMCMHMHMHMCMCMQMRFCR